MNALLLEPRIMNTRFSQRWSKRCFRGSADGPGARVFEGSTSNQPVSLYRMAAGTPLWQLKTWSNGARVPFSFRMLTHRTDVPYKNPSLNLLIVAHLIGDGSFVINQPIRYISVRTKKILNSSDEAARHFGFTLAISRRTYGSLTSLFLLIGFQRLIAWPGRAYPNS